MLKFLKYRLSLGYFSFALVAALFFILTEFFLGGFQLKDIEEMFVHGKYVIAVLYVIMAFFFVWAIFKMFTSPENPKENQSSHQRGVPAKQDNSVSSLLYYGLEQELAEELKMYERIMKRGELYGRVFSIFAIIIPGLAYVYLFFLTDSMPDLGFMGFSSMVAGGTIGLTMAIALLKHSKSVQPHLDKLNDELILIRKIRIVSMINEESFDKNLLMSKIIDILFQRKSTEPTLEKPVEEKSDLGSVTSIFSSIAK